MAAAELVSYWTERPRRAFVAAEAGEVLGTYYLRPNQPGGGAHVCNCGYATRPEAQGRGIARAMLEHSLAEAKSAGFQAMQFNFVVASNNRAIALWQRYGFAEVGRLPRAFAHPREGLVDALVMYRWLG
ncbi:MAG: GNAT family N-acetyltransferase [Pseudomonadota bacterium]